MQHKVGVTASTHSSTGRREAGGLFRRVISPGVLWEREGEPGFSLPPVGTALSQPSLQKGAVTQETGWSLEQSYK